MKRVVGACLGAAHAWISFCEGSFLEWALSDRNTLEMNKSFSTSIAGIVWCSHFLSWFLLLIASQTPHVFLNRPCPPPNTHIWDQIDLIQKFSWFITRTNTTKIQTIRPHQSILLIPPRHHTITPKTSFSHVVSRHLTNHPWKYATQNAIETTCICV